MKVMQFQGMKHKASSPISLPPVTHLDLTPSPEVPLTILKRKLMSTNDLQESRNLVEQIHRHLDVSSGSRNYFLLLPPASLGCLHELGLCLLMVTQCHLELGDSTLGPPLLPHGSIWRRRLASVLHVTEASEQSRLSSFSISQLNLTSLVAGSRGRGCLSPISASRSWHEGLALFCT